MAALSSSSQQRGLVFGRYAKALGVARGNPTDALGYCEGQNWSDGHVISYALKAAVTAQSTADIEAAAGPVSFDFSEAVRPQTVVGKLAGLRRVPFSTRILIQTTPTVASWVSEGLPKPTNPADFIGETLEPSKVSAVVVITRELLQRAGQRADEALTADMIRAVALALDIALIDPGNSGSASKPASITHGAAVVNSTGSTLAAIDADLKAVYALFVAADVGLALGVWVMHPLTALYLALLRGSGGSPAFPNIGPKGGVLLGLPVITSTAASPTGSPGEHFIALVDASEILLADDNLANVSVTTNASLQMDDAPSSAAANQTSLWQNNLAALRVERFVSWRVRRSTAAAIIANVTY